MAFRSNKLFLKFLRRSDVKVRNISDIQKKIASSYYSMFSDVLLSSSTVGQTLDTAADQSGDRISFISAHQGISKTYTEFRQEVNKLASGLISLGLQKGDRIAICSPNCYEWPVLQFASAKAGLILVNINPANQAPEIEYCLKEVQCKAIVSWDILKTQNYYEIFNKIIEDLPKYKLGKIENKNLPHLERIIMISDKAKEGVITFNDAMNARNAESDKLLAKIENSLQFDEPINIQFTSGTTGKPKGALLSHHNLVNNAFLDGRTLGFNLLRSTSCCQVPLFHCFGCVLGTLAAVIHQGTCVLPSVIFNAKESIQAIDKYKCNIVYGTPTMYVDMLNKLKEMDCSLKSLKQAVVGGASSPEALIHNIKNKLDLTHVHIAYGATECSPGVAASHINQDFQDAPKGLVPPLPYLELKVIDNDGSLVPVNTQGELCVRGHAVFMGYWGNQEKTDEVIDKTRWYHTGDICKMNEYGFIQIVGRKKDMVIRGGENLFPAEIESFLHSHPAIIEAQVVGVPDERMGEELCAWICLKDGQKLTEEELRNYCQGKISHFKIPRYIMFVESFPKTESGKVKKYEIRRISMEKLKL